METQQQFDCEGKPSAAFFLSPQDCFMLVYENVF